MSSLHIHRTSDNKAIFESLYESSIKNKSNLSAVNCLIKSLESDLEENKTMKNSTLNQIVHPGTKSEILVSSLEEKIIQLNEERNQLEHKLAEALDLKENTSKPLEINNTKNIIDELLANLKKLSGSQKRRLIENIFEKVVIKSDNTVCLHIYDDLSRELKKRGQVS